MGDFRAGLRLAFQLLVQEKESRQSTYGLLQMFPKDSPCLLLFPLYSPSCPCSCCLPKIILLLWTRRLWSSPLYYTKHKFYLLNTEKFTFLSLFYQYHSGSGHCHFLVGFLQQPPGPLVSSLDPYNLFSTQPPQSSFINTDVISHCGERLFHRSSCIFIHSSSNYDAVVDQTVQQIITPCPRPPGTYVFSCPSNRGLGPRDLLGQWDVTRVGA